MSVIARMLRRGFLDGIRTITLTLIVPTSSVQLVSTGSRCKSAIQLHSNNDKQHREDSMALIDEVQVARKKVVTDGYEMSLGELMNLYRNKELLIDPAFQRLFRWDDGRKTRFIESILLGIPFPPIFVFQNENGVWELIDGLQRLSTILQLTGDLEGERARELGPLILNGTQFLPSLNGKRWVESADGANDGIGQALQIDIKRSRVRVEILKSESDLAAKYELFQRLNTGGARLSEQEVRNSMAVAVNPQFYRWLAQQADNEAFRRTTAQTETAIEAQAGVELVLRFLAFRSVEYQAGLDVHEYLDHAMMQISMNPAYDMTSEGEVFSRTFQFLDEALGDRAFKRWNGATFGGKFLMSVFEVLATGVSKNLERIGNMEPAIRNHFLTNAAQTLWSNPIFLANSGAGVRGTTRLANLLPLASQQLNPNP